MENIHTVDNESIQTVDNVPFIFLLDVNYYTLTYDCVI
jgi:hypothetical protein